MVSQGFRAVWGVRWGGGLEGIANSGNAAFGCRNYLGFVVLGGSDPYMSYRLNCLKRVI